MGFETLKSCSLCGGARGALGSHLNLTRLSLCKSLTTKALKLSCGFVKTQTSLLDFTQILHLHTNRLFINCQTFLLAIISFELFKKIYLNWRAITLLNRDGFCHIST